MGWSTEVEKTYARKYYHDHKDYYDNYYKINSEKIKKHRKEHRAEISKQEKEYNSRPEIKEHHKIQWREYNQRPEIKQHKREYERKYRNRPGVKERRREYQKEYYLEYFKIPENKEKIRKGVLKFMKSEKGRRHRAKRLRNLGFNVLFENVIDEPVDWHHVNDDDVVALPRDIHQDFVNKKVDIHRESLNYIIKQIYPCYQ